MKIKYCVSALVCAAVLAVASPAGALIEMKWTVGKLYKDSKAVVIGKIASVEAEKNLINIALPKALKGKSPGDKIRIQFVAPVQLPKELAADQPLVFFLADPTANNGAGGAVLHVADQWLLASGVPKSEMLVWRVVQVYDAVRQSFPGRTSALVKMTEELNAGTSAFMDKFEHKTFDGGVKVRAKLAVNKATWLLAEDVNGDKKPDLLIGSAAGVQLFLAKGDGYEDATEAWGLKGSAGSYHAAGDVNGDGKPDLLLDKTLWINQGQKFAASNATFELPAKGAALAAALIDATGDGKPDAIFLSADGEARIYENPGEPEKPWTLKASKPLWAAANAPLYGALGDFGDDGKIHAMVLAKGGIARYALDAAGAPPADLSRLAGVDFKKLDKYHGEFKNATAVALTMNGEGRPDFFVFSDAGTLLLLNRGFGTFFADETAAATLTANGTKPLPLTPSPATVWARADLQGKGVDDVLLLGNDGTLYEISNKPR